MPERLRDPTSLLMALAMSGTTCLLLAVAISNRARPEAQHGPNRGEARAAGEFEVQLVGLAPGSDVSGEPPAAPAARPTTRVRIRAERAPTARRESALEQPASTPRFNDTHPPAPSPDARSETDAILVSSQLADDTTTAAESSTGYAGGHADGHGHAEGYGHADGHGHAEGYGDAHADGHGHADGPHAPSPPPTPSPEVLPFAAGMTRPRLLSGGRPAYTAQALAAHVEGKVIVRCAITAAGNARDCHILKALPLLDRAAVQALLESRFAPATFQGRRVAVHYVFTFDFRLP